MKNIGRQWLPVAMSLCLCGLAGCGSGEVASPEPEPRWAKQKTPSMELSVNGFPIYVERMTTIRQRFPTGQSPETLEQRSEITLQTIEYEITRELWRQDMEKSDHPITHTEIQEELGKLLNILPHQWNLEEILDREGFTLDEFCENIAISLYRERIVRENMDGLPLITDEEVHRYFDTYIRDRDMFDSVEARQIFIGNNPIGKQSKESRAQEAWQYLKDGKDFAEVAWLYSDHSSHTDGGRIGRIWHNSSSNTHLENILFSLKPGEFSDVINGRDGCYILKVDAFYPQQSYPRTSVDAQIRNTLTEKQKQKVLRNYQLKLAQNAHIQFLGRLESMEKTYWQHFYPELQPHTMDSSDDFSLR